MTETTMQKLIDPNDVENWLFKEDGSRRWIVKKENDTFYYQYVTLHPNGSIASYKGYWYSWSKDFDSIKKWAHARINKEPLPEYYYVIYKIAAMEERFKKRQEIKHARHNDVSW